MQSINRAIASRKGTIALTVALVAGLAYMGKLTHALVSLATLLLYVSAGLMRLGTYTAALGW